MKCQGNEFYKQEKFIEAAKCYEEAVRLSEGSEESDRVVAVYHQNLAAVYDAMVRRGEGRVQNDECRSEECRSEESEE